MRSLLAATLIFVVSGASAQAQMTAPSAPSPKPKPVVTVPIRPALQSPADTANAMVQAERQTIQSDLAWVGEYNGAISGEVSERMVAAIKEFQKAKGGRQTGVLNPQERGALAETAKRRQENVGWKVVTEAATGARLGIPTKLVPQQSSNANGARWSSSTGTIQIQLSRRKEANPTTVKLAEQEKKEPAGRKVEYTVVKPDFFVLSGMQGLKKFYVRGQYRGDEVRILTVLYDQATEGTVEPVVIAMSSAFNPFPSGAQVAGPPPRKTVEYATGIVVSDDGAIIADREVTDGCLAIAIAGYGHADRVAEDKEHGLALLRIYGAHGLKPLTISNGAAKSGVEITGIADPQSQGGGAAVSSVRASLAQVGSGNDFALSPAPAVGFSGAAVQDSEGKFAGVALLKPVMVAGPPNAATAAQAALVSADTVQKFLKANGVNGPDGSSDAKASVVRVICVRK
jgi:peptidoglycan hydrolase-like protein with peptidoglycan-binding domain